ncbi:MAG: MmcQ/YjbR family DNA-binding protein [Muribaculum sp.]|nr:MmcQ/YjbR family DNA-binding protein [Muribaculum sp.]
MNIEDFRKYCLSLPAVSEKMPFQAFQAAKEILAFYVNGHIFCYFDIEKFDECTLKCDPAQIPILEEQYIAVGTPYNMSHKYWIGVKFNSDMPDNKLFDLVRQSYDLVKSE